MAPIVHTALVSRSAVEYYIPVFDAILSKKAPLGKPTCYCIPVFDAVLSEKAPLGKPT